jgi:hypothetical protein
MEEFFSMVYYLSAIYEDDTTRLGTFANRVFRGKDINRVVKNFEKQWKNKTHMDVKKIIGVQVESCLTAYSEGIKHKVYFNLEN